MRRFILQSSLALATATFLVSSDAHAQTACWYNDLEHVDNVTAPPQGGDNDFFTRVDVPPNLMWVLDNSGSMQLLSCGGDSACTSGGNYNNCGGGFNSLNQTFLINKGYKGYTTLADAYDAFDRDFCTVPNDARSFSGDDGCYVPNYVYSLHDGGSSSSCQSYARNAWVLNASSRKTIEEWCGYVAPISTPPNPRSSTKCSNDSSCAAGYICRNSSGGTTGTTRCYLPSDCRTHAPGCPSGYACNATNGKCEDTTAYDQCVSHLKTYGYYPGSSAKNPVFTGDLLNFYPPKHVAARRILKDMVLKTTRTRQGLITLNAHTTQAPVKGTLLADIGPNCGNFFPPVGSHYTANQALLLQQIDKVYFQGGTPLAKALTAACQYVTGDPGRFATNVKVKNLTGVGVSHGDVTVRTGNNDTMCVSCQKNIIAVITDGLPSSDSAPCRILQKYGTQGNCTASSMISNNTDALSAVADFCFSEDLRPENAMPGKQNAIVHTVGFDITAPILEQTAQRGGGLYYEASDATELRLALSSIVSDVNKRATSFSVASVSTVQTRGTTHAFVPRFRPSIEPLWEGHMYQFKLFSEFAMGCRDGIDTVAPFTGSKVQRNPNQNTSCEDVYLVDANNDFITETDDGEYLLADTTMPWTADGWPAKSPAEPAVPVWDASAKLAARNPTSDPRKIYTVVDLNNDGVLAPNEMIEFKKANVSSLVDALGLDDVFCASLAARLSKTYANRSQCANDVIEFIRGIDIFDDNKNGNRTEMRERPLGDIFHSSPVLVTGPVTAPLCATGRFRQCLGSLFSAPTPNGEIAYNQYVADHAERTQIVLVGANDGMLHAFHSGDMTEGDDPDTAWVEDKYMSLGTGDELWAFIPPDLLPKLKRLIERTGRHEFFVDGTAMVRDIWVDSATNPGQKDPEEFRTIAIVGERQGGRSYFALDVTDPANPAFRWVYPGPGKTVGFEAGETWNDFAPGAPPIGPVALADADGPFAVSGKTAREVWSVLLSGGFDPNFIRGRAMTMVDAWTGAPIWRFSAYEGGSNPQAELFPVAATASMLDLGSLPSASDHDDIYDTAVVGDTMGQIWTLRFHEPGEDTDGDGLVDNWFGARAFIQFKGQPLAKRSPFFQSAEVAIDPVTALAKVYVGAGDRANIRSQNTAACSVGNLNACDCGLSNLGACLRKGCHIEIGGGGLSQRTLIKRGDASLEARLVHAVNDTSLNVNTLIRQLEDGNPPACSDSVKADYKVKLTCGSVTETYSWGLTCDPSDPGCVRSHSKPERAESLLNVTKATENARFYALNIFANEGARAPFSTLAQAKAYDQAALTDTDLQNANTGVSTGNSPGYYIPFEGTDERTASAAIVNQGCVFWTTMEPDEATDVTACGAKVADKGRSYTAHYGSGSTVCGNRSPDNAPRYSERRAIVPPPAPTPVVSVNPETSEVRYGLIAVEPGLVPSQETIGEGDLLGPIYWLEVSPETHDCRHGSGACD